MSAALKPPTHMTVEEFLAWTLRQPGDQRFELIGGEMHAMAPPSAGHARAIKRILRGLDAGIDAAGVDCEAFLDGPAVRVGTDGYFIPDVVAQCGDRLSDDDHEVGNPVIVVEVVSPSTSGTDAQRKLVGYFNVPSVRHYLIVDPQARRVVHHARGDDGVIVTSFHADEPIRLDPPGITLEGIFPTVS